MYGFTVLVYSPKNTLSLDKGDYMAMTFQKHHLVPEETGINSMSEWLDTVYERAYVNGHEIVDIITYDDKVVYGNLDWHESEHGYEGPEDLVKRLQEDYDNMPDWIKQMNN